MSASLDIDARIQTAHDAGLRYISGDEPGYRWGRGFTYLTPEGEHIKDRELRARFEDLTIPKAWTDVWICRDEKGHIQATGRDDAARKQYIYHPEWRRARERQKFRSIEAFARHLPALRAAYTEDLAQDPDEAPRRWMTAVAMMALDRTHLRVGNEAYVHSHGTHGLTTLTEEDLVIGEDAVTFDFDAKSGQHRHFQRQDRDLATYLHALKERGFERIFSYVDDAGEVCVLDSADINAYLHEATTEDASAKDFRTWGGTQVATQHLLSAEAPDPDTREDILREAVDAAADHLGNTRAVCRAHYIHPDVLSAAVDGSLWEVGRNLDADALCEEVDDDLGLAATHLTDAECRTLWMLDRLD